MAIARNGSGDYGTVFDYLRQIINCNTSDLKVIRPDLYIPIVYFVSASRPSSGDWAASLRKLIYTDDPTKLRPVVLAFGIGDADEDFISQVATFSAFMAESDTDPAGAMRTIISRLTTSLVYSAPDTPDLPTSLPGFRSIAPAGGIAGNK